MFQLGASYLGASATDQQLADLLYEGGKAVAPRLRLFYPSVVLQGTAGDAGGVFDLESSIAVDTAVVQLRKVVVYNVATGVTYELQGPDGRPGVWSYGEFVEQNPSFRTAEPGQPLSAVAWGTKLMLSPPPDDDWQNYDWYLECLGRPLPFIYADDSGTDLRDLGWPEESHFAMAYCAAAIGSGIVATHQEAWDRLRHFDARCAAVVEELGRRNAEALVGKCWSRQPARTVWR